ncbi:hypothetical protein [Aquimarina sp. RZ0]|uniref:jacalin-like lectin n=1 Tax=Aquimarina sp. RZ0 TaxID=2607730 RepID=UPI0011F15197|nr:hypothetical protein [Aquimarina sp. RZ0]KAA1243437.1 hypothetical protein F0000_20905 [Aquimarina sp. RZ0]
MKKTGVLALLFIAYLSTSCEKKEVNEILNENIQQDTQKLTHYDEANSSLVDWNDFPKELKNAIPLENSSSYSNHKNSKAFSYSVGPFGGGDGSAFSVNPPSGTKIHAIAIRAGSKVDKITIFYISPAGTIYTGTDRGGNGGIYHIQFFSDDEYIIRFVIKKFV